MIDASFQGKKVRWRWVEGEYAGSVYQNTFHKDGTITWLGIEGGEKGMTDTETAYSAFKERTDGAPMTGEETYYLNQQADGIFTLSWIEDTGFSVSQNLDFNQMQVYAFMSWNDPTARGGRAILDHKGSIKLLD